MKKLFASLLAATMVAGMAVSAFAYVDNDNTSATMVSGYEYSNDDYTFVTDNAGAEKYSVYKADSNDNGYIEPLTNNVVDGGKLYFPILVSEAELKDNGVANKYAYATYASEVEDLRAKVSVTAGKEYVEKEAKIVRKKIEDAAHAKQKTVYCVEVKLSDFNFTVEKEIEFDLTLYNKGRKQVSTKDETAELPTHYTYGADAYYLDLSAANLPSDKTGNQLVDANANDADGTYHGAYKAKFRKNELTMSVLPGAMAFEFEEATDVNGSKDDIEVIHLDFSKADASFEVAASSQDDLFLGYSTDADKTVVLANPEAELKFVDFDANPTFDFMGTLKLTVEDPDKTNFCYELKDGKLTPVGKYNAEDECFDVRTRQLTSYVLSDKELVSPKADEEKPADKPVEEKPADKVVGTGAIA